MDKIIRDGPQSVSMKVAAYIKKASFLIFNEITKDCLSLDFLSVTSIPWKIFFSQ